MSTLSLICLLPPGAAGLAERVIAAGGIPVVDVVDRPGLVVPAGAWVRTEDAAGCPGEGPVIIALGGVQRVASGRPTWFESTTGVDLPTGAAGVVLLAADAPAAMAALRGTPRGTAVLVGGGLLPEDLSVAIADGAHGVILSGVLEEIPEVAGPNSTPGRGREAWLARRAGSLVAVLWAFRGAMMGAGGGSDGLQLGLLRRIEAHLAASAPASEPVMVAAPLPDVVVAGLSIGAGLSGEAAEAGGVRAAMDTLRDAGVPLVVDTASGSGTGRCLPKPLRDRVGVVVLGEHGVLESVAEALGASGPGQHLLPACAGSAQAASLALDWIRCGRADAVLVLFLDQHPSGMWLETAAGCDRRGGLPVARLRASILNMSVGEPESTGVIAACAAQAGIAPEELAGRSLTADPLPVAAALRAVQYRRVPADVPSPAVEQESVSGGTEGDLRYVVDVSLGPPVAALVWERVADGDARVKDAAVREAWLCEVTDLSVPVVAVVDGVMTAIEGLVEEVSPPASPVPPAVAVEACSGPLEPVDDGEPSVDLDHPVSADVDPTALLEPAGLTTAPPPSLGNSPRGLHPSVRLRRPRLVPERAVGVSMELGGLAVTVLGEGGFADALRGELVHRGADLEAPQPAVVVDAADGSPDARAVADALTTPPDVWASLSRLGADPSWVDPEAAVVAGGRLGFTRVLARRWPLCRVQAIDLDPMLDDSDAAACAIDEIAARDRAAEVFHDGGLRQVVQLQTERFPAREGLPGERPVVVIAGSLSGPAGRVATELAGRGPTCLALLDENVVTDSDGGGVDIDALRALGAEVLTIPTNLEDEDAVVDALAQVREGFGLISGAVYCPTGSSSGEAAGEVRILARQLDRVAWLLCLGSLRGRLGYHPDAERVIGEGAVSRLCLSRPRSVHLAWPGEPSTPVSAEAPTPVEERAAAALAVDLVAGGVTGDLLATGPLRGLAPRAAHPLLDRIDYDGDAVVARTSLVGSELGWARGADGSMALPATIALELLAATACCVQPGAYVLGVSEVRFPTPVVGMSPLHLMVRAEPYDEGGIACVLSSEAGDGAGETYAMGVVLLGDHAPLSPLPPTFFFSGEPVEGTVLYQKLARRTPFQVLQEVGVIASRGLIADGQTDHEALCSGLLSAPLVLEAALQACAVHAMAVDGTEGPPLRIDRVQLEQPPLDHEDLGIMVRCENGGYNVDVDGPRGAVLRLRGLRLGADVQIDPSSRFAEPPGGWPEMVTGAARATGGAGSAGSSDTIPEAAGVQGNGPAVPVDVEGGPG